MAEVAAHLPVPVGAKAITPSIPDAQHKPRKRGEKKRKQVPFACSAEYPAEHVEEGPGRMEEKEEYVEKLIHALSLDTIRSLILTKSKQIPYTCI